MKHLFALFIIFAVHICVNGQDCEHKTNYDRFREIRISSPAQITQIDGMRLTIVEKTAKEVVITNLTMSPKTSVPKDVYKFDLKKLWLIMYCLEHKRMLAIAPAVFEK